jgi:hypothetical protein
MSLTSYRAAPSRDNECVLAQNIWNYNDLLHENSVFQSEIYGTDQPVLSCNPRVVVSGALAVKSSFQRTNSVLDFFCERSDCRRD